MRLGKNSNPDPGGIIMETGITPLDLVPSRVVFAVTTMPGSILDRLPFSGRLQSSMNIPGIETSVVMITGLAGGMIRLRSDFLSDA